MLTIINGNIDTMGENTYENGMIIIDGKKIKYVGDKIEIPEGSKVIDACDRLILPGFIDAHSHLGMWEECTGFPGDDGNELTDPITPQLRAIDSIYPMERPFEEARNSGITSTATGPGSTNVIGGQFAAIKTYGVSIQDMIIKAPVAMKCAFGENPKNYYNQKNMAPITRMGIAAMLRETLFMAKDYYERKLYANGDISKMPVYNFKYESLIPVITGELPLKAHVHRADDILTAIRIAKEFGLKMTLDHCTEGHLIVDEVRRSGFGVIIGPSFGFKTKNELRNKTFETCSILSEAGVKVAIMTDHPVFSLSDLPYFVAMAAKYGMSQREALKAVTINAAEILGIDDKVGSIEAGKDADIVIWDESPLNINFKVNTTIIDGKVVYGKNI